MLPIYMIQSQVFWLRGKPLRNIQPFNGFAPMQDIERLLNKMFPKNSALVLILLHARKLDGRFYLSGGLWSVLWPGSTIPAVFPKTMKCLSVLHKLFAPLLPSALYSSGFSLLVQLLNAMQTVQASQFWVCPDTPAKLEHETRPLLLGMNAASFRSGIQETELLHFFIQP